MINLLPPKAQRQLAREYRLRFLSVVMMAVACALLVLLLLSLPVWLMQKYQLRNMMSSGDLLVKLAAEQRQTEEDAKTAMSIIKHFESEGEGNKFRDIIAKIDSLAGEDINITQFSVDAKKKLTITGVATVRTSLSAFRDRLEEDKQFSGVTLPLSSLVDESDVTFSITLNIK